MTIKIRGITADGIQIGRIIDSVAGVSGVKINGVSFDQSDRTLGVKQARKAAYESAKTKAEEYADLSGFRVVRATRI